MNFIHILISIVKQMKIYNVNHNNDLTIRYDCKTNFEICNTIHAINYLNKYIKEKSKKKDLQYELRMMTNETLLHSSTTLLV